MNLYDEVCPRCGSMMNRNKPCGMCDYTFPFVEEENDAEGTERDNTVDGEVDIKWYNEPDCLGGEG